MLENFKTAPIDERLRAALQLLEVVTQRPQRLGTADIEAARAAGLSDQAIREALYVCFAFNVMDRLADAFGFPVPSPKVQRRAGQLLYRTGYRLSSIPG